MTDETKTRVDPASSFDGQIEKMAQVIRTCALAYAVATRRSPDEYIEALISQLKQRSLPSASLRSCD